MYSSQHHPMVTQPEVNSSISGSKHAKIVKCVLAVLPGVCVLFTDLRPLLSDVV